MTAALYLHWAGQITTQIPKRSGPSGLQAQVSIGSKLSHAISRRAYQQFEPLRLPLR